MYTVGISVSVAKVPVVGSVKLVVPVVVKVKAKFPEVVKLFAKEMALPFICISPVPLDIKFKPIFVSSPVAEIEGDPDVAALDIVNSFTALATDDGNLISSLLFASRINERFYQRDAEES